MGFRNDEPTARYIPGIDREGRKRIEDVIEAQPLERLRDVLRELDTTISSLPSACRKVLEERNAFTIVMIDGVRDWQNRRHETIRRMVLALPTMIAEHGQASLTIETCSVWVMLGSVLVTREPIRAAILQPYEGFENLPDIPIPDSLIDPESGEHVSTGEGGGSEKYLRLRTSSKNLRLSDDLKARNVIRIWNDRNNVASWPLPSLDVMGQSIAFVYGELRVPDLKGEHLADAHRSNLADTPLTRALRAWSTDQIQELANRIQKAEMRKTRREDREKAGRALAGLRDLMRQFLEAEPFPGEEQDSSGGAGKDEGDTGNKHERRRQKFGARIDEIVLEPTRKGIGLALGTKAPLVYRCYEINDADKRPVMGAKVILKSAVEGHAVLDSDGFLKAEKTGKGEIWLETADGRVTSNHAVLEVVRCTGVDIVLPSDPLLKGQRVTVVASFHTIDGQRDDLLLEATIDEPGMAWLGRSGILTAGLQEGTATLHVKYGPERGDRHTVTVTIGPERVPPRGTGGGAGGNVPEILLCGEPAPGMDSYPPEQRTHPGGEYHPTIIEEPQFPNVVWINPYSKEASRVRRSRGGPSGVGGIATQTFMHFVALKCFEILKRLKVRQEMREQVINETEFTRAIAQAEMDCAGFIDAAFDISEKLLRATDEEVLV